MTVRASGQAGTWDVYVMPSKQRLKEGGIDATTARVRPIRMITIDETQKRVRVHPHFTRPEPDGSFTPKYTQVTTISFDLIDCFYNRKGKDPTSDEIYDALRYMPNGMVYDPNFGLGVKKDYRFILKAVCEVSSANVLYIGHYDNVPGEYKIARSDFEEMVAEIDRIDNRAQKAENEVKATTCFNMLAPTVQRDPRPFNLGRNSIRQLITKVAGDEAFEDTDIQAELVSTVSRAARNLVRTNPKASAKLVSEIQVSRLEHAVLKYDQMMDESHTEGVWQKFFESDPILLAFSFGYPLTFVNKHPYVGGMDLSGRGENIGDFLYKNSVNNNAALIEIKKPQTPLMRAYRTSALAPHQELSGGVVQALNQKRELMLAFPHHKMTNHLYGDREVNAFDIDCVLVVGTMPTEEAEKTSFQLYRKNSHGVQIVTFDEVLSKLKQLLGYLTGDNQSPEKLPTDDF